MPTVRCPEHGVFAYKTVACPGCAAKAAAARCKLAQDARSHWEKEIARVQREIAKKRRELAEQVRDAESCLDAHDRNVPEAPTGIGALFKQAAYDREYSDFLDRRNTLAARIADAKTQSAQYDERIKAGNIAANVMTGMIRDMPEATDATSPTSPPVVERRCQKSIVRKGVGLETGVACCYTTTAHCLRWWPGQRCRRGLRSFYPSTISALKIAIRRC